MPIYEYECQKCKAHVEILQKISDKPLSKCKKCGGKLEKQWSNTSFQLKGSGWYVTDYAGKKADSTDKKTTPVEKSSTSTETSSSDKGAGASDKVAGKTPEAQTAKKASSEKSSTPANGD